MICSTQQPTHGNDHLDATRVSAQVHWMISRSLTSWTVEATLFECQGVSQRRIPTYQSRVKQSCLGAANTTSQRGGCEVMELETWLETDTGRIYA